MSRTLALLILLLLPTPAWAPPIRSQSCDATGCTIVTQARGTLSFTIATVAITTTVTIFQDGVQRSQVAVPNMTCAQVEAALTGSVGTTLQTLVASDYQVKFHCITVNPFNVIVGAFDSNAVVPATWW